MQISEVSFFILLPTLHFADCDTFAGQHLLQPAFLARP
jgi:hypothetical protein